MNITLKFLSLFLLAVLTNSCDLDQVENRFIDYNDAVKDDFFIKGWIPESLILESMKDIFVKSNIDLNTCVFSYKLSQADFDSIKTDLLETDTEFEIPRRIKIPKWWFDNVSLLSNRYYITDNYDLVFISIDSKNNKIYGWRN
jgi:hypothetical protein